MKLLVVGGGGREHTLVWKLAQSPRVDKIYCAPGNAGIAAQAECVPIGADDVEGLLAFAKDNSVGFTVVGPEAPLVAGIVDAFQSEGLRIFGPDGKAARIEGSKQFAKEIMDKGKIPTARSGSFTNAEDAFSYIQTQGAPIVVKADGLAAGKGVTIASTVEEAEDAVRESILDKRFGDAGDMVVVEELLDGEEVSIFALTDGKEILLLAPSQDHKRIGEGDTGPNTGGMGAYSPVPKVDQRMLDEITDTVLAPTLDAMALSGCPYKGILYAGLIQTGDGLKVLEYNCRFGDPEAQAVIPRIEGDLLPYLEATVDGTLRQMDPPDTSRTAACVVVASGGYPGSYEKGKEISGINDAPEKNVIVFHAGTKAEEGRIVTSGGRVLGVTGLGDTLESALKAAYSGVERISFEDMYYRNDIGHRALPAKV